MVVSKREKEFLPLPAQVVGAIRHYLLRQKARLGQDTIQAHSRHSWIATLILYVDEHDRQQTQQNLADLVAGSLTT